MDESRRRLLKTAAGAGFAGAMMATGLPAQAAREDRTADVLLASDFGAIADGTTDNTGAFQEALDAADARGGGIVFAPAGRYLFKGHLTIPANVTLEGTFQAPAAFVRDKGTVLLPTEGRGQVDGPAFISSAGDNTTIKGLGVYYPEQDEHASEPTPYPWTIQHGSGDNLSVIDCALTNPYQAIDLTGAGRHYIARVYGQPIAMGIYVDRIFDIGRIENIHFWRFWTQQKVMCDWINAKGVGLRIGRTDWEYVLNTFVLGYSIGYHFIETKDGAANGNFLGIGSDFSGDAVVVEQTQENCGLLITNGEFVGDARPDSQGIIIRSTNLGPVTLQNCAFWGPSDHIGTIEGTGPVTFIGSNFADWDKNNTDAAAFVVNGGGTTIANCQFLHANKKLVAQIEDGCASAVIAGNTLVGSEFRVDAPANADPKSFQIAMNVVTAPSA